MNLLRLVDTLKRHEGTVIKRGRHMPYTDSVGKVTIGMGRNLSDKGISDDEAKFMLMNDISEVIHDLRLKYFWFDSLDDVRQEVVINMAFNMGMSGFGTFRNTISDIEIGNYSSAAGRMLRSKWARQVGRRAIDLSGMMKTGLIEV